MNANTVRQLRALARRRERLERDTVGAVLAAREQGGSLRAVGEAAGLSHSTIRSIERRYASFARVADAAFAGPVLAELEEYDRRADEAMGGPD